MLNKYSKFQLVGLLSGVLFAVSSMSASAAIDVSVITAGIAEAATAVAAIGAAVVLVVLGVKIFKWVARSL